MKIKFPVYVRIGVGILALAGVILFGREAAQNKQKLQAHQDFIAALPQQTATIKVDSADEYDWVQKMDLVDGITRVDVVRSDDDLSTISFTINENKVENPTGWLMPALNSAAETLDDFLAEVDESDMSDPEIVEIVKLRDKVEDLREDLARSNVFD